MLNSLQLRRVPSLALLALAIGCANESASLSADADNPPAPDAVARDTASPRPDTSPPSGDVAPPELSPPPPDLVGPPETTGDAEEPSIEPVCEGIFTPREHVVRPDQTFRRGPYLQSVLDDSAVIVWHMGGPSPKAQGCVVYEVDHSTHEACTAADEHGQFVVRLTDLPPESPVDYRVRVMLSSEEGEPEPALLVAGPFRFESAAPHERPMRLLVFADAHANETSMRAISEAALAAGVHGAIGVGDLVNEPEEDQWDSFFEGLRALGHLVPFWPVIGNHERLHESYFRSFVVPGAAPPPHEPGLFYAARQGNVWFAALHLYEFHLSAIGGGYPTPQVAWLREQLTSPEARLARWRFLLIHEPPYAQGWGRCDHYRGEVSLRQVLVPLAAELGVHAIFSGHVHGFEQGERDDVLLVTTGGAGGNPDIPCDPFDGLPDPWLTIYEKHYTLVTAECDRLRIEAIALDGTPLAVVETDSTR